MAQRSPDRDGAHVVAGRTGVGEVRVALSHAFMQCKHVARPSQSRARGSGPPVFTGAAQSGGLDTYD